MREIKQSLACNYPFYKARNGAANENTENYAKRKLFQRTFFIRTRNSFYYTATLICRFAFHRESGIWMQKPLAYVKKVKFYFWQ